MNMNEAWLTALMEITEHGESVSPRGADTLEILGHQLVVDMTRCVLTVEERALGYRFMAAEAAWLLEGDNRVATIAPYSKAISQFSDDGVTFFGAYGPRVMAQISAVLKELRADSWSRRAVINIWRENPMKTKDYPCHLSCQFLIRDGALDCFVAMRSSDIMLGVPYDVFNFSMLSAFVLLILGDRGLRLGRLFNTAASRHLYLKDKPVAALCLEAYAAPAFAPMDVWEFENSYELIAHLWQVAQRVPRRCAWLGELP